MFSTMTIRFANIWHSLNYFLAAVQMLLLRVEVHMLLVLDPSGAPMLSVLVKRVDWLTVVLIVIQAHALIPMMLELHAMLLVSKKLIYHIIIL